MKEIYNALEKVCDENNLSKRTNKRMVALKEELRKKYDDLINILVDSVPENIPDRPGAVTLLLMYEVIIPHFAFYPYLHDLRDNRYRNIFRAIYKELGGKKEIMSEEFKE